MVGLGGAGGERTVIDAAYMHTLTALVDSGAFEDITAHWMRVPALEHFLPLSVRN